MPVQQGQLSSHVLRCTLMKHPVDPEVERVFKRLSGAGENRSLPVHVLNGVADAEWAVSPVAAEILDPGKGREFRNDGLGVVDIRAHDRGAWILPMLAQPVGYPSMLRKNMGAVFGDQVGIWVVERDKFKDHPVKGEREPCLTFFTEGEGLDDACLPGGYLPGGYLRGGYLRGGCLPSGYLPVGSLPIGCLPAWMHTLAMERAMAVARRFPETGLTTPDIALASLTRADPPSPTCPATPG